MTILYTRRGAHGLCAAVLLGGVLAAACARADDADGTHIRERLHVEPGVTCLTDEALAPEVAQWLHGAPIDGSVQVEVEGSATDARSARLRVVRNHQVAAHRAFEPGPARCDHLRAAVGLAIALALKASLLEELGQPLPDDPSAPPPRWALSTAVLISYRLLPDLAPGAALAVAYALGEHAALRFGVLGAGSLGVALDGTAGSFDAALGAGRVEGCVRGQLAGPLHGGLCFGFLGGALFAAGSDVATPTTSVVGMAALTNAGGLRFELSRRWSLELDAAALLRLNEVRIGLQSADGTEVGSRSLKGVALLAGLGVVYSL